MWAKELTCWFGGQHLGWMLDGEARWKATVPLWREKAGRRSKKRWFPVGCGPKRGQGDFICLKRRAHGRPFDQGRSSSHLIPSFGRTGVPSQANGLLSLEVTVLRGSRNGPAFGECLHFDGALVFSSQQSTGTLLGGFPSNHHALMDPGLPSRSRGSSGAGSGSRLRRMEQKFQLATCFERSETAFLLFGQELS